MSNYINENLISVSPSSVPAGTLAMKVGNNIFTAGSITKEQGDAYVVISDSGTLYVQKLQFNGTEASDAGSREALQNVMIFNTGHPQPEGGSSEEGMSDLQFFDWYTILNNN